MERLDYEVASSNNNIYFYRPLRLDNGMTKYTCQCCKKEGIEADSKSVKIRDLDLKAKLCLRCYEYHNSRKSRWGEWPKECRKAYKREWDRKNRDYLRFYKRAYREKKREELNKT